MIGLELVIKLYGVQQKELAEELGIRKQNINLWIKGKQDVSKKHLPMLSKKFGVTEAFLKSKVDNNVIERIRQKCIEELKTTGMENIQFKNEK